MTHTKAGILQAIITKLLGYSYSDFITQMAEDMVYQLRSWMPSPVSKMLDVLSVLTAYWKSFFQISSSHLLTLLLSFIYWNQNVLSTMAHTVGMAHSLLHEFCTIKTTTL